MLSELQASGIAYSVHKPFHPLVPRQQALRWLLQAKIPLFAKIRSNNSTHLNSDRQLPEWMSHEFEVAYMHYIKCTLSFEICNQGTSKPFCFQMKQHYTLGAPLG